MTTYDKSSTTSSSNKNNPREYAFLALRQFNSGKMVSDSIAKDTTDMIPEDRRLATILVLDVIRRKYTLDRIIDCYVENKFIDYDVRALIQLALYQIKYLDKIPDFAAVNESVNIAKRYTGRRAAGFVNAVLRTYLREPEKGNYTPTDEIDRIGFEHSHPKWLIKRLLKDFSPDKVDFFCKFNNIKPNIVLRINPTKTNISDYCELLDKSDIKYEKSELNKSCIKLKSSNINVINLPGFNDGLFIVQDETPARLVDMLNPQKDDHVLDLCAAPGGKTCVLATQAKSVTAVDINPERMKSLDENIARLGIKNVDTMICDLVNLRKIIGDKKFDKILVDVPCSNTGVFRRRVEARWRIKSADFPRLTQLQTKLLRIASGYLADKGQLLYSTCSIDPSENDHLIDTFLKKTSEFRLIKQQLIFPNNTDSGDGGYGALISKI